MNKLIDNIEALRANNITVIDNFLSISECEKFLDNFNADLWSNSKIAIQESGLKYHEVLSNYRTNKIYHYCFLPQGLKIKLSYINKRLEKDLKTNKDHFEPWQLSKYKKGDYFDFHLDCGNWKSHSSGDREKTVLIYLNSPKEGGETYFRALNLSVRAVRGRLITWENLLPNGNCNHAMIHAGLPVKSGEKVTLNTWVRQKKIVHISSNKK